MTEIEKEMNLRCQDKHLLLINIFKVYGLISIRLLKKNLSTNALW